MNKTDGIVRTQVHALRELLEQSRTSHCNQARQQAELQAAEIRRRIRGQARERVRKAAHEERERLEREIRMVQAELETEHRKRARKRDTALIAAGRAMLAEALAARWRDASGRIEWTANTLAEAADVLRSREWRLEHPKDWPAEERDRAIADAQARYGASIQAEALDDLESGLRIHCGGALVDMSIPGLLANERAIEGELLAQFNHAAGGEPA
jgi:hypothetical protein